MCHPPFYGPSYGSTYSKKVRKWRQVRDHKRSTTDEKYKRNLKEMRVNTNHQNFNPIVEETNGVAMGPTSFFMSK